MPKMQIVTDAMLSRAEVIGRGAENILSSQNTVTQTFQNMGRDFSGRVPGLMIQHMASMESDYKTMNNILNNFDNQIQDNYLQIHFLNLSFFSKNPIPF
mgnify:CR=1 FL=1